MAFRDAKTPAHDEFDSPTFQGTKGDLALNQKTKIKPPGDLGPKGVRENCVIKTTTRHPELRQFGRAVISARIGVRDLAFAERN